MYQYGYQYYDQYDKSSNMREKETHAARKARLIGTNRTTARPSETNRAPVGESWEKKIQF